MKKVDLQKLFNTLNGKLADGIDKMEDADITTEQYTTLMTNIFSTIEAVKDFDSIVQPSNKEKAPKTEPELKDLIGKQFK